MSAVSDMMDLGGTIRVMMNSPKVDGSAIAKRMSELAAMLRDTVRIKGDIDVTFDPANALYVLTLKRPSPAGVGFLCSSCQMFKPDEIKGIIPQVHIAIVRHLNRLDGILTREERVHGRKGILR
jgi:hypothetical protein